jgi:2-dehydropantoate 2-reductase
MVQKVKNIAILTGENTSSMLSDIKRGLPTEIDFINGFIVHEAQKKNVPVPMNSMLLSLIKSKTIKF